MRRVAAAAALAALALSPASAEPDFAGAVDQVVTATIAPGYGSFADAAREQVAAMEALCAQPGKDTLAAAEDRFEAAVLAWSEVELIRFGPAREENRFEKLFYWPDRKGRGLKQVQRLLATEDETALEPKTLSQKSVAVQGLPALEFVLHGTGAEALSEGDPYRCAYGRAIAVMISAQADALRAGWSDDGGFAAVLRNAGGPDSPYRSHAEVVQDLLRAAGEQLQIVRDIKIVASIGDDPKRAKPKRAPFWRSGLTVATILANLRGVEALLSQGLDDLLPEADASYAASVAFELRQARDTLDALTRTDTAWPDLAGSEVGHRQLSYVAIPIGGAMRFLTQNYPAALGLTLGFNSLDGD